LLRLRDERAANRVSVVKRMLKRSADLLAGHFVVATDHELRIRSATGARASAPDRRRLTGSGRVGDGLSPKSIPSPATRH
jgi:hypothetical protein